MRQSIVLTLICIVCIAAFNSLQAQDIVGRWKTIDDETGKAKSIVNIYVQDGSRRPEILRSTERSLKVPLGRFDTRLA